MFARLVLLAAGAASAAPMAGAPMAAPAEHHCVVEATGVRPTGELIVSAPRCYRTFDDAMRSAALSGPTRAPKGTGAEVSVAGFTLGIHYDGFGFSRASFSVVGDDCLGGYLNMDAVWNDRVSSTWAGCPRVRHWAGHNATGASQTLAASGNLSTLNNKASSIQYLD